MKPFLLFPYLEPMPPEAVHVGVKAGNAVCCRISFGPLGKSQVEAIGGINIGLPDGFSLESFSEGSGRPVLLADGSVVFSVRVALMIPPGEYSVRVSIYPAGAAADALPSEQAVNRCVIHVYPNDFPAKIERAKKSPAECRAFAADQN